ncbi:hypothetical protein MOKP106_42550 [Mycobacterium avium subsp. hominissuis]
MTAAPNTVVATSNLRYPTTTNAHPRPTDDSGKRHTYADRWERSFTAFKPGWVWNCSGKARGAAA